MGGWNSLEVAWEGILFFLFLFSFDTRFEGNSINRGGIGIGANLNSLSVFCGKTNFIFSKEFANENENAKTWNYLGCLGSIITNVSANARLIVPKRGGIKLAFALTRGVIKRQRVAKIAPFVDFVRNFDLFPPPLQHGFSNFF